MKIELILARLNEYLKMLEVDEYQLKVICNLLVELLEDMEKIIKLQPSTTIELYLTDQQLSNVYQKLGAISAAIKQLSPRRGSLMSRNSHIPWKLFMIMDATIHNKAIPSTTLANVVKDIMKNNEIKKLSDQFKLFEKDTKEKKESCNDYRLFLNKQSQLLIKLYEYEKELSSKLNMVKQAHMLISSISQMIQEQKLNEKNLHARLDDMKLLKRTIKDDAFLTSMFSQWENEIGFDIKNLADKKLMILSLENNITVQLKYYNEMHNTLSDIIENIKNVRMGKEDQLNLSQIRTLITKMINDLINATTDEDVNNVKILSYKVFLKCIFFSITDNNIQDKLTYLQNAKMSNKDEHIKLLKELQESINPFQEHRRALDEIRNTLTDKNKGFPFKIEMIVSDKDTTKDQKIYKILHSNLKKLLSLKEQKSISTLSPHIQRLIKIYLDELLINISIDLASISDKIAVGVTDRIMKHTENLKAVYTAIDNEKSGEQIQDTSMIFEKVQKYTANILQEQKSESDLEADLNFCPSLCRFLQYNFDIKNLNTILDTSKTLIKIFHHEDALQNPVQRITFLYSLLVIGESTKDFSYRLRRGTRYDFTPSLTRKIHSLLATTVFNAALVLPHMLLHRKLAQHVLQTT